MEIALIKINPKLFQPKEVKSWREKLLPQTFWLNVSLPLINEYNHFFLKGMIDYLDERSNGFKPSPPKPLNWAERALKSYTEKREAAARSNAINPDVELLHKIRNNVNTYTVHAKAYARKYTTLSSLMLWMHQWQNKQDPTTDRSDASQNQASSIIVLNWNPAKMSRYQKYDNKKTPKKKSKTKQNKRG